jgi:hypothetical protein
MEASYILSDTGLQTTPTGLKLEIRLPWYRTLPLSTIEMGELRIGARSIDPGNIRFELAGRTYALEQLPQQIETDWFILDSAYLHVSGLIPPAPGELLDISVTLNIYPPYIPGFKRVVRDRRTLATGTGAVSGDIQLGTTLYALTNEYLSRRYSFEALLREIAARSIGPGLEIVGFQSIRGFPVVTDEFAERFCELIAELALVPTCLGLNADQEIRRGHVMSRDEQVAFHEKQLRAAARLRFPLVRYQYGAGPEVIERLVPLAEKLGVKLGLEIHAPQHANHPDVLRYREMYARVGSPFLGWIPDFSSTARSPAPSLFESFRQRGTPQYLIDMALESWNAQGDVQTRLNRYREGARKAGADEAQLNELSFIFSMFGKADPRSWLELMPQVIHVHGKFYGFDADGNEEAIDYPALLPLFQGGGFKGYISSEWEGHMYSNADAFKLIQRHQAMCRRLLVHSAAPAVAPLPAVGRS